MQELIAEIVHEVSAEPVTFAIELVQFGLLVFLIKAVAFGFRGKRGMVTGMLADRRENIGMRLADAASAAEELIAAREVAGERLSTARAEAREFVAQARASAEEEAAAVLANLEGEVTELRRQAEETLEKERAEMLGDVHEQLVDLVTMATRAVLEEGYTPSEQRQLIQRSVMESLDNLESVSLQ